MASLLKKLVVCFAQTPTSNKVGDAPEPHDKINKLIISGASSPLTKHSSNNTHNNEIETLKKQIEDLKAKARETRLRHINQAVCAAQALDLAFCFDATGSMGKYMEVVKSQILKIVKGIHDTYPESEIRVAFVFYRDYKDKISSGSCKFTKSFDGSRSKFVKNLSQVEAKGGDDTAEDVFSGLERLAKLNWKAHNRVVYHIADAPCHGIRFHDDNVSDSHPGGDLQGRHVALLLHKLREDCKLSTYTFLHITTLTHKMLQEFKIIAKAEGDDSWIHEDELQGKVVDDIPNKVVTTCKSSISDSLSKISSTKHKLSKMKFVPRPVQIAQPDWNSICAQDGEVYSFKRYNNLDEVLRMIEEGISLELEKTQPVQVQAALHPFSNDGASRWPFYAQVIDHEFDTKIMVLKRFKDRLGQDISKLHSRENYIEQMEVQAVSAIFAEEFNHCICNIIEAKKVIFTVVTTLQLQFKTYYNMEKVLNGSWTKFNSNAGYVNKEENYIDTLQAFSHWTHERSNGILMVTDLQGVHTSFRSGAFLLCDPAIHSRDVLRFTRTNLGEKGFELFYKSHKCNSICERLGLSPMPHA